MIHDPLERLFDESQDVEMDALLELLGREIQALSDTIPGALTRQWEASPIPKPREDTSQRSSGDRPNPTADIVFDSRRLALRESVERARQSLRVAVVHVRASRIALEHAIDRYDGDDK